MEIQQIEIPAFAKNRHISVLKGIGAIIDMLTYLLAYIVKLSLRMGNIGTGKLVLSVKYIPMINW